MNYDYIENLSEDEMLELYDDIIENNLILMSNGYYEITCSNGIKGYFMDNYTTPNVGERGYDYSERCRYCNDYSTINCGVCRVCGYGVTATVTALDYNAYSEQASNCNNSGGTMVHPQICRIPAN